MISITDVSKTYTIGKGNEVQAVRGVSMEINPGDFTIIIGRSGSGKTTLLNLAAGLTRPTSGRVMLDGIDIWNLSDSKQSLLRSQKLGFVFQFPSLLPSLTIYDNVLLPALFLPNGSSLNKGQRAVDLLNQVGLGDKLAVFPRQLSAGQQQRVVIARALMNQPEILLADEPTSNLDEQTEMEIMALFGDLHANLGITIMMVTHTHQLLSFGTRAIEMANGQIISVQEKQLAS